MWLCLWGSWLQMELGFVPRLPDPGWIIVAANMELHEIAEGLRNMSILEFADERGIG